jgi:taurine dioxygenase
VIEQSNDTDWFVRSLPNSLFGAEVVSFDLSRAKHEESRSQLRRALNDYLLLIVRDQDLSPAQQVEFTALFGRVQSPWDHYTSHAADARVQVLVNAGSVEGKEKLASQYWHVDQSFMVCPSQETVLHPKELPDRGGDTLFADMRTAFDRLPADLLRRVVGQRGCHSFAFRMMDRVRRRGTQDEVLRMSSRFPDVIHPIVRHHPMTGRRSLYLSELCLSKVVGLAEEESNSLLAELYQHALRDEFILCHEWRPGDLAIWENGSLMHRATDSQPGGRRVLHCTNTEGAALSEDW